MPNHIQNRLKIEGTNEEIKEVFDFIKGEKNSRIDFNKIIPMPDGLDIEASSLGENAYAFHYGKNINQFSTVDFLIERYSKLDDDSKIKADNLAHQYQKNFESCGHPHWYSWCPEVWGTKWNAYKTPDDRDSDNTIFFQTAWAGIPSLILKLSELFPSVKLYYDYADEDIGYNVGSYIFINEKAYIQVIEKESLEAYNLAFELMPEHKEYYVLVDGKYKYNEE